MDAQRHYVENSFKFRLSSIGIFNNESILHQACRTIQSRLNKISQYVTQVSSLLSKDEYDFTVTNGQMTIEEINEIKNRYCDMYQEDEFIVLKLFYDDYTVGKIIEKYMFHTYEKDFTFIGFKKEHPTKKESFIYFKPRKTLGKEVVNQYIDNICKNTSNILDKIVTGTSSQV